ncbi:hypothetical protein Q1695_012625 [Nippostrongylus brasiliensis]|nr:hypothetical protein Q1695_012625 [Nippostrongylus brasiliensis]
MPVYAAVEPTTPTAMPVYAAVSEPQLLQKDRPLAALVGDDSFHIRKISLTEDQRQAVALGLSDYPVVGIQAGFGTGRTMIGA